MPSGYRLSSTLNINLKTLFTDKHFRYEAKVRGLFPDRWMWRVFPFITDNAEMYDSYGWYFCQRHSVLLSCHVSIRGYARCRYEDSFVICIELLIILHEVWLDTRQREVWSSSPLPTLPAGSNVFKTQNNNSGDDVLSTLC